MESREHMISPANNSVVCGAVKWSRATVRNPKPGIAAAKH